MVNTLLRYVIVNLPYPTIWYSTQELYCLLWCTCKFSSTINLEKISFSLYLSLSLLSHTHFFNLSLSSLSVSLYIVLYPAPHCVLYLRYDLLNTQDWLRVHRSREQREHAEGHCIPSIVREEDLSVNPSCYTLDSPFIHLHYHTFTDVHSLYMYTHHIYTIYTPYIHHIYT